MKGEEMIRKFFKGLDQKYLKICVYAAVTVLLTWIVAVLLSETGPFWSKLWAILGAMIRPVIIGGIICYLLLPIVNRLEKMLSGGRKRAFARPLSVLITFAIIAVILIATLVMITVSIYKNIGSLNFDSITGIYAELQEEYKEFGQYLEELLQSFNINTSSISTFFMGVTGAIESFLSGLLFGVIFAVYFLLDEQNSIFAYWSRAFRLIFGEKQLERLQVFMQDADQAFSGYIRGQMVDAVIVGALASIALSIAGVPYAVLIGVLMGIGNLIPYVGPIIGYAATVIVCLPSGDYVKMVIGLVIIAIIMFIDGNIINPRLLSDNVDVHPLLVVAALLGGGVLGGIAGMLIAVPTAALIKMQFDRHLNKLESNKEEETAE